MGGGGKGGTTTSTQTVQIPPEVLARYNAVNARAEQVAQQPFQPYGGEFVAPLTPTQTAGIQATSAAAGQAQPYYGAATRGLLGAQQGGAGYINAATQAALAGGAPITPDSLQTQQFMNPYTQSVVGATQAAMGQQFGQQQAQQQAEAIRAGAYGGDRAGLQRQALRGQQALAGAQAIAPLYQQGYQQAQQTGLQVAQANRAALQGLGTQLAGLGQQGYTMGAGTAQQLAGLGTGAQQAALQGAQAQLAAGQIQQQTQQAQDTAQYQQFLQERGYPFQVAQFLANIAMGTGALSGSTTTGTTTQPGGFFSDKRLKEDVKEIGETHDGQPIYSYKYKGDDRTQIGLMAQDVEKKHPEAVGLMGGYKTVDYKKATEDAERSHKDMGGGLVPDGFDASSMGGAVTPDMSGEGFERGGYVGGGLVGNDDWAQIIAANKQALGMYGGQQPLGGAPGATGIVPAANIPVPKPIEAAKLTMPAQRPSGLSSAMQTGKDIAETYKSGKELYKGLGEAKDWLKDKFGEGGLVPRHAYAYGGGDDSQAEEAIPYDPSDVMRGRDPMEGVLKAGSQKPQQLKAAQMSMSGSGGGGGLLGGIKDVAGGIGALKTIGEAGSWIADTALPFLFAADGGRINPYAYGGLVPRQGYATRGATDAPEEIPAQATEVPAEAAPADDRLERTLGALRRIESGGKYDIVGPTSRKGDRPYGAYQIMGANVPSWTEAALGRRMTPEEFLKDQAAQDATARHRAGLYLKQYDDPRQVASMWLSGKPMEKAGNVADVLGTNVPKYVSMFDRYYGGQDLAPAGREPGLKPPADIGATSAPSGEKKSIGDVVTSEGFLVPALGFLGSMLASNRPNLGQALGEGIMGGVGAYQAQRKLLPDIAKVEAETAQMLPVATARNIEAANKLATGLMQYNASLPPGAKRLTLQEYAKVVGYTGPIPPDVQQAAKAAEQGETKVSGPESRKWALTPDEKESLVVRYPDGTAIPAYNDPSYLKAYANKFTAMGEGWAKEQAEAASAAAEKNKVQTFDINGNLVTVPGAIESGQKQEIGKKLAEEAAEFNREAAKFKPESQKIIGALNELETVLSQFRTGADAPARANLDRIMKSIDPENKFKLSSSAAGDYDTIVKDAMFIGLSQLAGLSPRAPASELNAIRQTIPDVRLDPGAVRNIISKIKADTEYKQKMYDAFDIDKNVNVTKFQKEFMEKNPYDEFLRQTKKEIRPGAGTEEQRAQPAIPQRDLVPGKIYRDASGVQKKWTGSGWENP